MAHAKFLEKQGKQPLKFNTSHRKECLEKSEYLDFLKKLLFILFRAQLMGAVQKTVGFYAQLNTVTNFYSTNYTNNLLLLF